MIKKILSIIIISCLIIATTACTHSGTQNNTQDNKISIVTTLFATYDFAKNVAGECANVNLLLDPGVESHTYEPSPADIIKIKNADLFIYTGKHMESWAAGIIENLDTEKTTVLDVSKDIELYGVEHMHENHGANIDPHIWTSPQNAITITNTIADALCDIDKENASVYEKNKNLYVSKLQKLDNDFESMINSSKQKEIMFGGRFAMYYFAKRYNLEYSSAYDSCSSETEPGAKFVANIIDQMKEKNIAVIYYEELSNHNIADQIAAETGAQALLLHSCHNVSRDEFMRGETYISLMEQNFENLKKGLN